MFGKKILRDLLASDVSELVMEGTIDEVVKRATFLSYMFSVVFFLYGFVSLDFNINVPERLNPFHTILGHFLYNSIPCLLLVVLLRFSQMDKTRLMTLWLFLFSLIYLAACWISAWPISLFVRTEFFALIDAANAASYGVVLFVLLLPPRLLWRFFVFVIMFLFIPAYWIVHEAGIDLYSRSFFINTVSIVGLQFVIAWGGAVFVLRLRQRLYKNHVLTTQLLRTVVHDLSNHLFVIRSSLGKVDIIRTESSGRAFNRLNYGVEQIVSTIGKIREIEGITHGDLDLKFEEHSLRNCLADLCLGFSEKLEEKKIKLTVRDELNDSDSAYIDKEIFINSILGNFFSNAIKFTPENGSISLLAYRKENQIIIAITDSGAGISADMLARIQAGDRVDSRLGTKGEQGMGYGMQLALFYLEQMNGHFSVYSNKKILGTTIRVYLPVKN